MSQRIAFACCHDASLHAPPPEERRRLKSLRWGVAAVEAETAHHIYPHLPATSVLFDEVCAPPNLGEEGIGLATESGGLARCLHFLRCEDNVHCKLRGTTSVAVAEEAVVYIPGYNTSLAWALQRFGQVRCPALLCYPKTLRRRTSVGRRTFDLRLLMTCSFEKLCSHSCFVHLLRAQLLSLCHLPSYMLPLVFSWPGGSLFSYAKARDAATRGKWGEDLVAVLVALRQQGVRQVHLLAHSLGASVLLHALDSIIDSGQVRLVDGVLSELDPRSANDVEARTGKDQVEPSCTAEVCAASSPQSQCHRPSCVDPEDQVDSARLEVRPMSGDKIVIRSVILLSPDFPLKRFFSHSRYLLLRLSAFTTVYGDHTDRVLSVSAALSGHRALGQLWLDDRGNGERCGTHTSMSTSIAIHPTAELAAELAVTSALTADNDMTASARVDPRSDSCVDIVDTSSLGNAELPHVDLCTPRARQDVFLRHTHFSLCQVIADDIREILTTGRRGAQREGRLHCHNEGTYQFRAVDK